MNQAKELPKKPIGIIASVAGGLDSVIQGWWVLLFPVLLDLFLWFGPRLSVLEVAQEAADSLMQILGNSSLAEMVVETTERLNYFSVITVAPLGVPSLMAAKVPQANPLGTPGVYTIQDQLMWLGCFILLTLLGLVIGGVYLGLIAQQVRDGTFSLSRLLRILPRYWFSILAIAIGVLFVAAVVGIPVMLLVGIVAAISGGLATVVVWVGFMAVLWVVFHLFFTVHGILLSEESFLRAVWNSVRLTAFNSFPTMGLIGLALAINAGLGYLWALPKENSWMLLVGVVGHAVISSGLVAATFVFYQDRFRYWQELQRFLTQATKEPVENSE